MVLSDGLSAPARRLRYFAVEILRAIATSCDLGDGQHNQQVLDCAVAIKRMDNGTQPRAKFASYFFLLLTVSVSTLLLAARIREAFDPADDPV